MSVTRLTLDARYPLSREVACFTACLARRADLGHEQVYRLRLAADEITDNAVVHGYRQHGGPVVLDGGIGPRMVWLRVEDEAPPFDPRSHDPLPRLAAGPGDPAGGFGLFLALRSVDRFRYEYTGGCNRCTMWIRR